MASLNAALELRSWGGLPCPQEGRRLLREGLEELAEQVGVHATDPAIKVEVSRADVADFMLKQVSDDTYLRKTAGISY